MVSAEIVRKYRKMEIYKIVLVGIIATVMVVLLREMRGELAMFVALASGIIILIMSMTLVGDVVVAFSDIAEKTGVSNTLYVSLIKIIGVGYITEFAANICEDANCKSISGKILLGGKVAIMVLALPTIKALIEIIIGIL